MRNGWSRLAIIAALTAFGAFATAAVLFMSADASFERLGLLFGLFGTIVVGLIGALRSDEAAKQTSDTSAIARSLDGGFDKRVKAAVRDVRDEPPSSTTPPGDRGSPGTAEEPTE